MKPFFNTHERIALLDYVAIKWFRTPWTANSASRGVNGGVACHLLPREIYVECGFLLEEFPRPAGTPQQATHQPIMEIFLDADPHFQRLPQGVAFEPGDLLGLWLARDAGGLRCARHVNHLGVVVSRHSFIHVLMHKQTDFDNHNVPPWQQRIAAAWRPMENETHG